MIVVSIVEPQRVSISVGENSTAVVEAGTPVVNVGKRYEGAYLATPSAERQVFRTEGLLMSEDFVVNPVPANYGLITRIGDGIMVS